MKKSNLISLGTVLAIAIMLAVSAAESPPKAAASRQPPSPAKADPPKSAEDTMRELVRQGRYVEAERELRRVLPSYEQDRDAVVDLAATLNHLVTITRILSKYDDADQYVQRWIVLRPRLPLLHQFHGLHNLALLRYEQGRYAAARRHLEAALALQDKLDQDSNAPSAKRHMMIAEIDLARVLAAQGQLASALSRLKSIDLPPADSYLCAQALEVEGSIRNLLGRHKEAGRRFGQAYWLKVRIVGNHHKELLPSLHGWAMAALGQGDEQLAARLIDNVVYIQNRRFSGGNFKRGRILALSTRLPVRQGKWDPQMLASCGQALALQRMLFSVHPDLQETLHARAIILWAGGDSERAIADCTQALRIRAQVVAAARMPTQGEDVPVDVYRAELLTTNALIEASRGRFESAEKLLQESLDRWKEVDQTGLPDPAGQARTLLAQAIVYAGQKPPRRDPEPLYEEWWRLSYPHVARSELAYQLYWLERVFSANGQPAAAQWLNAHAGYIHRWLRRHGYRTDLQRLSNQLAALRKASGLPPSPGY